MDGGGDKLVLRVWNISPCSGGFEKAYNSIQDHLDQECGSDDFLTGTFS